jgi:hypothetical protein
MPTRATNVGMRLIRRVQHLHAWVKPLRQPHDVVAASRQCCPTSARWRQPQSRDVAGSVARRVGLERFQKLDQVRRLLGRQAELVHAVVVRNDRVVVLEPAVVIEPALRARQQPLERCRATSCRASGSPGTRRCRSPLPYASASLAPCKAVGHGRSHTCPCPRRLFCREPPPRR